MSADNPSRIEYLQRPTANPGQYLPAGRIVSIYAVVQIGADPYPIIWKSLHGWFWPCLSSTINSGNSPTPSRWTWLPIRFQIRTSRNLGIASLVQVISGCAANRDARWNRIPDNRSSCSRVINIVKFVITERLILDHASGGHSSWHCGGIMVEMLILGYNFRMMMHSHRLRWNKCCGIQIYFVKLRPVAIGTAGIFITGHRWSGV